MNRDAILTYLSSSELNRCKKNGLNLFEARESWFVLDRTWMPRKLRRKLGHLMQMDLLPKLPNKPIIGLYSGYSADTFNEIMKDWNADLAKKLFDAEDKIINELFC